MADPPGSHHVIEAAGIETRDLVPALFDHEPDRRIGTACLIVAGREAFTEILLDDTDVGREAAIAELERLLPAHEQTMGQLTEATVRVLEAVATVACESFVRHLSESGEMAHLRSRFERLRAAANAHATEIDEWSRRTGRPLRIPRITFPWPPAAVWTALLDTPVEAPELRWDDDPEAPSA